MKIYRYTPNGWTLWKTEILPSDTPTMDETLETFSFALISDTNPLPYAPMQKVKVDFLGDGSEIAYFYIVSDSVETYSLNPLKYKHTISCIQNTRELSKHLVRNSVFSQPPSKTKTGISGVCEGMGNDGSMTSLNEYYNYSELSVHRLRGLNKHEKVANVYLKIDVHEAVCYREVEEEQIVSEYTEWLQNIHTIDDMNAPFEEGQLEFIDTLYIKYTDSDDTIHDDPIDASYFNINEFTFGERILAENIKTLLENGARNIFIHTGQTANKPNIPFPGDGFDLDLGNYPHFIDVQFRLIAETYYYNCLDILQLLVDRQKQDNTKFTGTRLFELPQSTDEGKKKELYDLLVGTIAPNFTFTQLTMYECVAEVFRLFDAIFTLDEDNCLGIEYFNDWSGERINPKLTGRNLSIGEDKYTNGLVSYYQDGIIEDEFPKGDKSYVPVRSSQYGAPSNEDHYFITPHKIQSVISLKVILKQISILSYKVSPTYFAAVKGDYELDLSDYLVSEEVWSTLNSTTSTAIPTGVTTPRTITQNNALYFREGDNKITIGVMKQNTIGQIYYVLWSTLYCALCSNLGIAYTASENSTYPQIQKPQSQHWEQIYLRLKYNALIDGRVKIESLIDKYNGETLIDQSNGAVDLNKMGLNMLGLSLKLGNPTLNATHRISSWANRIQKGQIYPYTINNKVTYWVANVVNYTFFNGKIQGKVSFVQNFNQLALRTQLLREKRMTNISKNLIQKSEDNYIDFVYYSSSSMSSNKVQSVCISPSNLREMIKNTFIYTTNPTYKNMGFGVLESTELTNKIYMPCIRYGSGNNICFEFSFDDPISAGNETLYESGWWSGSFFTKVAKYTDDNGFLEKATFSMVYISGGGQIFEDFSVDGKNYAFPEINYTVGDSIKLISIPNLKIWKQPNEILALNYQLSFLPLPDRENIDFIGVEFINDNFLVNDQIKERSFKIVKTKNRLSVLDRKINVDDILESKNITTVSVAAASNSNNITEIKFNYNSVFTSPILGVAIVDEDNNVIFGTNNTDQYLQNTYLSIFMLLRHERYK